MLKYEFDLMYSRFHPLSHFELYIYDSFSRTQRQMHFFQVIVKGENGQLYGVPSVSIGGPQMLLPHGQLLKVTNSSGN